MRSLGGCVDGQLPSVFTFAGIDSVVARAVREFASFVGPRRWPEHELRQRIVHLIRQRCTPLEAAPYRAGEALPSAHQVWRWLASLGAATVYPASFDLDGRCGAIRCAIERVIARSRGFALVMGFCASDIEEFEAEVIACWQRRLVLKNTITNHVGWLARSLRNRIINALRARDRHRRHVARAEPELILLEDLGWLPQLEEILQQWRSGLNDLQRQIIDLKLATYGSDKKPGDAPAADQVDLSVDRYRRELRTARAWLRVLLLDWRKSRYSSAQ